MAVLPAPSGYSCVKTLTNFTQNVQGSKTIPTGSFVYIPSARATAMATAGACTIITVEPSYTIYTAFGDGSGQWPEA